MTETIRISMWSGPRNLSTALMYSFRERTDTTVFDEPLYGYYLAATGTQHPMRAETLASMETDADTVLATLSGAMPTPVAFFKNMAHHTYALELDRFRGFRSAILTREPRAMLASLVAGFPQARLTHTGLPQSVEILDWLIARGEEPIVLEAGEILKAPRAVLGEWCDRVGIGFDDGMLSWPAGPKPEDGVWASHWYTGVHGSTGFGPYQEPPEAVPDGLEALYADCRPLYERLMRFAIRA